MQLITLQDLVRRYFSGEGFVLFDTETTGLNTYHDDVGRAVKQLSLFVHGPYFGSDVAYIQKPDREYPYGN